MRQFFTCIGTLAAAIWLLGPDPVQLHASAPADPRQRPSVSLQESGGRLYLAGLSSRNRAVAATVQGDLRVKSTEMPCINCHRRSGWGTTEGPVTTPPVVGRVLFAARVLGNPQLGLRTTGPGTRPAYDDASLLRAIRDGIDPAGRRLMATMPRYEIEALDGSALSAYLRSLNARPPDGVNGTTLHFATITSPSSNPLRQDAMLAVFRAFAEAKNAGTRLEAKRRDRGPWDMKSRYDLYRDWQIHEWALTGPPADWARQLAEQYARQPVFAVIGGIADGDWTPVHHFCEQSGLPCIFPQTGAPPEQREASGFYAIYFSRGLTLEADALAQHLRATLPPSGSKRVLQVARCGSPGEQAARRLATAIGPGNDTPECVNRADELSAEAWRVRLAGRPEAIVPWLGPQELRGLSDAISGMDWLENSPRVFLSASLAGDQVDDLPATVRDRAYLVSAAVAPDRFEQHAARGMAWLKERRVRVPDRQAAVNALFAVSVVADAVGTPRVLESREYFVEQIEHMVGRSPQRSAYPSLSLSPQRRFASLGCSVLKIPSTPRGSYTQVVPWFIPEIRAEGK